MAKIVIISCEMIYKRKGIGRGSLREREEMLLPCILS